MREGQDNPGLGADEFYLQLKYEAIVFQTITLNINSVNF